MDSLSQGRSELNAFLIENLSWLQRLARAMAGARLDANDLVQDTVERALMNAHRYQPGSSLKAWLRTIMHNLTVDGVRRSGRFRSDADAAELAAPPPEPPRLWSTLDGGDVQAVMHQLPVPMRTVYQLFAFEGASYQDIARRTGTPTATVATRIFRARQRLRGMLVDRLPEAKRSRAAEAPALQSARSGGEQQQLGC